MSLPAADRIRYRLEVESVKFHVLALTALDPRLTLAQAERFGSAADDLYREILIFSGLVQAPPAATPVATGEPVAA